MLDLSFLTDEEQEAILKVLQRDANLKKVEEERVRHLPEKVKDDNQMKNMSGQWFYEAKSKRHREKIHGADIIRASIRRKPLTIAELSQSRSDKAKNSWVSNVNKDVSVPPELLGVVQESEGEPKLNQRSKEFRALEEPEKDTRKTDVSPSKQRKNPFNDSVLPEDDAKSEEPEFIRSSEATKRDTHLPSVESQSKINLANLNRVKDSEQPAAEPRALQRQSEKPIPKARKNVHKASDVSLKTEDPFPRAAQKVKQVNGHGTPTRGILKRSSSSSSTDSEVLRLNQSFDPPNRNGLPTSTILEGVVEKSPSPGESEEFSQNSLERLKQVRFSSSVTRKEGLQSLELHEGKEPGEFTLLDADDLKASEDRMRGFDTLQSDQTQPVKPPRAHFSASNGNTKDGVVSQEEKAAPSTAVGSSSGVQPSTLQSNRSTPAELTTPSESSDRILLDVKKVQNNETQSELKNKPLAPEPVTSKSSTGPLLPLATKTEDPQMQNVGSADLEQGKPAPVEIQSTKVASKSDKYAAEFLRASDESISKVLDWFNRSSSTGGKATLPLMSNEMNGNKMRELAVTNSETGLSNLDSSVYERNMPTNKNDQFQSEQLALAKNGSLEQKGCSQNRAEKDHVSFKQNEKVRFSKKVNFQTDDEGLKKENESIVAGKSETAGENTTEGETGSFQDMHIKLGLKNADSFFGRKTKEGSSIQKYTDDEKGVKTFFREGNVECQSGEYLKEVTGKESESLGDEKMKSLEQQEFEQPSLLGNQKRVKDIRAYWEREKNAPVFANKDPSTETMIVGGVIPSHKKEYSKVKPVGGSSGYVTADSDSEQGKNNVVSFRKVELSEDDSEDNDSIVPSRRSEKVLPSNQNNTKLLDLHHVRPRQSANIQDSATEAEKKSALQQKSPFKIHSLKEKIDEDSKSEMLSPSQFQSLRSFWDVETKPHSGSDEAKVKRVVPRNQNSNAANYLKEAEELKKVREGISQPDFEGEERSMVPKEQKASEQNVKNSLKNVLEEKRLTSPQAEFLPLFPSVNIALLQSLKTAAKNRDLEEENVLPVKESIERTLVPSKGQHGAIHIGLQKLSAEASPESLLVYPAADAHEQVAERQTYYKDQTQHHSCAPAATDGKTGLAADEVLEVVNRTLAPSKTDGQSFNAKLKRLIKETSHERPSPDCHSQLDEQLITPTEQRRFFNKVMERSHDSYLNSQRTSSVGSQDIERTIHKRTVCEDQSLECKKAAGDMPRSVQTNAPKREGGQTCLDALPSQKEVSHIPTPALILPGSCIANQNRTDCTAEEVSERVAETKVPSRKQCSDLNSKLVCLLQESSTTSCDSCMVENGLKKTFGNISGEGLQSSYRQADEEQVPCSPQTANIAKYGVGETLEKRTTRNKDCGDMFTEAQHRPAGDTVVVSDHKNGSAQEYVRGGEQPKDVGETVEQTIQPKSFDYAVFKSNLKKLLNENTEVLLKDVEFPKLTHALLNPSSIYDKDLLSPEERFERIEKTTAPSNSRQTELKTNILKLLQEGSEDLPHSQKNIECSVEVDTESKPDQTVDLVCQPNMGCAQEVNETVNKTIAPSKVNQGDFNTGLQKLLKEVAQMPPVHLEYLDTEVKETLQVNHSSQGMKTTPQDINETVMKCVAPPKDDAMLKSGLEKLIKESYDTAFIPSEENHQKVKDDSAAQLAKQNLSVKMQRSVGSTSSDYRSEVRIPLKGKDFQQHSEYREGAKTSGVAEGNVVFPENIQVNSATRRAQLLDAEADISILPEAECKGRTEAGISSAGTGEKAGIESESQRPSFPPSKARSLTKKSQVELVLSTRHMDNSDDNKEDEDTRSFRSDLSDESHNSFAGIQQSSMRSEEEQNPVLEALKRSSNRQISSKSVEDIPSATSNTGKGNLPKEDFLLSAEDDLKADWPNENAPGISTAPSFPDSQFSNPEKVKRMSKSVPAFLQDESDDRETDTASDSSYSLGKIKKSPSSLTNLSGSSGLASLSSVSTSVMSIYSGDFGNVDVKGNIQFTIDYVDQLKELHIFIAQCKDLAVADVKKQRSDPYVKSYLLPEKYKLGKRKTSVRKKTLNPVFNEILRYKVDKTLLATQKLNISVWHNDTFGRNSFLGEVELDMSDWDWNDRQKKQMNWYPLKPRTPLAALELENRGEIKIALQYVPHPAGSKKVPPTGEVHIWVKECIDLPILRNNRLNSFVKCTILPDTSRKSRQKTRAVAKTTNPVFNHTMVYDGFRPEDLKEACVELTVWDHNKLANHFLGGLRIGLGTGKSYGTPVDWMDSTVDEISLWERMIDSPDVWVEDTLPLRMLMMAKMTK